MDAAVALASTMRPAQLNLYDAKRSEEARDAALVNVTIGMAPDWEAIAIDVVRRLCSMQATFTTDDVWRALDASGSVTTSEPRAMGAVMRSAAAMGLCETTDRTCKSVRVRCHRRPLMVWRSRVYA